MMMNSRRTASSASSLTTVLLLLIASLLISATIATANVANFANNDNAISESHHPHPQTRQARVQAQARQRQTTSSIQMRYPYTVSLQSHGKHVCAGSLIAMFAVVTSASCAGTFDSVVVGRTIPSGETFPSYRTVIHPNYNPTTYENDYMILLLPTSITNREVAPVELNRYDVIPHELTLLSLKKGAGDNFDSEEASLGYITNEACERIDEFVPSLEDPNVWVQESYRGKIHESMLCATTPNESHAACIPNLTRGTPLIVKGNAHDDGNSLVMHDVLFGSVSWGARQCDKFPGVFARVSTAVDWMEQVVCSSPLVAKGFAVAPSSFSCNTAHTTTLTKKKRTSFTTRQSNSAEWPHFLTLELTFDAHPEQVSWKFENARTSKVLGGVAFGGYTQELQANKTMVVPLDILTGEDYDGDEGAGVLRDYRFVIYDRGGNGLCCKEGNGKYEVYSKGNLVVSGDSYGAIEQHFFSIDPRDYLDEDGNNGGNGDMVWLPVVNVPLPTPAGDNGGGNANDGTNNGGNFNNNNQQQQPPPTPKPTPRAMPSLILSFFCGTSYNDAQENCHLPCPTGSPAECANSDKLDDDEYGCYASTTCRERYETPRPTGVPTRRPSFAPSDRPTPPPTSQPTRPQPTKRPTKRPTTMPTSDSKATMAQPSPTTQTIPTTQMAIDSNTWFCGVDWDWITDHCDEAIPCPRGDAVDCPANQACFASTPCTLSPTIVPTTNPSAMPSGSPTLYPTKSPWSEDLFVDFLYGQSDDTSSNSGGENNNGVVGGQPSSSSGNNVDSTNNNDKEESLMASQVNEALENYNSLQYHFFCGISWTHADETCDVFCPSGDKSDCPEGEECYANTRCDGRDTPSPTASPAPSILGAAAANTDTATSSGGEVCTLCENTTLDPSKSIAFQTQTTTCGNVDQMIRSDNILVGSATCNNARQMYRGSCCYDECQLCQTPNDDFLDLRSEHVVKQGGYEASCQEISNILSTSAKDDTICTDAQTQLGGECCYEQCTLCGDPSDDGSTDWYATVTFQGLTTTCLGLDYMLRIEQISGGSDQCSELRGAYMDRCCHASKNSCQLCKADGKLYEVDRSKTVTVEQSVKSTFTTCTAMNDSLSKLETSDEECMEGKQTYFGQCCDLSNLIVSDNDISPVGGGGGSSNNNVSPGDGWSMQQPSPGAIGVSNPAPTGGGASNPAPAGGVVSNPAPAPTSPGSKGQPTPGSSSNPTSSGSPSSEGQPTTNGPTLPNYWGTESSDWNEKWESRSGCHRAAVVSSVVMFGMSALLLLCV